MLIVTAEGDRGDISYLASTSSTTSCRLPLWLGQPSVSSDKITKILFDPFKGCRIRNLQRKSDSLVEISITSAINAWCLCDSIPYVSTDGQRVVCRVWCVCVCWGVCGSRNFGGILTLRMGCPVTALLLLWQAQNFDFKSNGASPPTS